MSWRSDHPGWFLRAALVTMLVQVAVGSVRPSVSYRALDIGAGAVALGIIAAGYAVISLLIAIPVGRYVDRRGVMPFLLTGVILICTVPLALTMMDSVVLLFVSQMLFGLGQVLVTIGTQALIANSAPAGRDQRFSSFTVFASVGQLIGPALGGLATDHVRLPDWDVLGPAWHLSGTPVFLMGAVAGVLSIVLTLMNRGVGAPPAGRGRGEKPISALRGVGAVLRQPNAPQAMLASIAVLTTIDLLVAYLPAYGEEAGLSGTAVGILLTVRAAASLVSRVFLVRMSRAIGRGRLLVLCTLLPALSLVPLAFVHSFAAVAVLMAAAGFGLGLGQPLSLIWITSTAPSDMQGTAVGVRMSGNRLGQVVIPMLVSGVVGATGVGAVFVATAALLAISSALAARADFSDPETG